MPANLSPEYKKAEAEFRRTRDPAERLVCLKEMLRTIPKHKGTEHLQANIKTRIKELTDELAGPKKGGARTGPPQTVHPEGAAQVALIGPPNSGKSSLHVRLTGSHAEVGPYPFTTHAPLPGMLHHQGVNIQLVDLPPIDGDYMESWIVNALQPADAALLVVDLSAPGCVESVAAIRERLDSKRVTLSEDWGGWLHEGLLDVDAEMLADPPASAESGEESPGYDDDPFRIVLPTILVASKYDLDPDPEEIIVLEELLGIRYPAIDVSAETGHGLAQVGPLIHRGLGIVRVYTKIPGHPPDKEKPYTLFRGGTVHDVARLIHKDVAEGLKFARIWGSAKFDGQQVGKDHVVSDGDVVELHS
jgi:ribosome-interacting GTPase 1